MKFQDAFLPDEKEIVVMRFGTSRSHGQAKLQTTIRSLTRIVCLGCLMTGYAPAETPSQRADAILRRAMEDRQIPGMQAAVIVNGKVVFSLSYGVANLQTPVPFGASRAKLWREQTSRRREACLPRATCAKSHEQIGARFPQRSVITERDFLRSSLAATQLASPHS
jgi:hypothetical protein